MVIRSIILVTALAAASIGTATYRSGDFQSLWVTQDQLAWFAYSRLEFAEAAEMFEDPMWKGTAQAKAGLYTDAAATFARLPTAAAFFNRGHALMKGREYRQAVSAFELAVAEAPDWQEAQDNLDLARYVVEYIERARLESDTGDESELGADDVVFDNEADRGQEIVITKESTIEKQSAEKWMRSVNTETRDFLRTRFQLESFQEDRQ